MGGRLALATAAADPRVAAVIAVCPMTDGLGYWLAPSPAGMAVSTVARAVREEITRRPATMPIAGEPGDFLRSAAGPGLHDLCCGDMQRH
jgi:pimeloyl-ACP methyl ester carboxylesterase